MIVKRLRARSHGREVDRLLTGLAKGSGSPNEATILGWLNGTVPVMGVVTSYPAKIFFIGDINGIEQVPQPFVDNLIAWGF